MQYVGELLIILGVIVGLVFWFRRQQQRELAKFMNDDLSAIHTLNKTLEADGRKPIDVPAMPLKSAVEPTHQNYAAPSVSQTPEPTVPVINKRRSAVLDDTRRDLLVTIEQALQPGYRVFAELRLSELVQVNPGANDDLLSQHLSFCICTAETMELVAGIQLYFPAEGKLNEFHRLFEQLQCPLITVSRLDPAGVKSVRQALAALNFRLLGGPLTEAPRGIDKPVPDCPVCQGQMRQRRVTRGTLANAQVWVCKGYPTCKGLIR
jgi:hypothetical protein